MTGRIWRKLFFLSGLYCHLEEKYTLIPEGRRLSGWRSPNQGTTRHGHHRVQTGKQSRSAGNRSAANAMSARSRDRLTSAAHTWLSKDPLMLQSHVIEIDGAFVGAAVRLDTGYRFIATDIRLEELDGTTWPSLADVRRLANRLFRTGRFEPPPETAPPPEL
jgi:hypothetical protein